MYYSVEYKLSSKCNKKSFISSDNSSDSSSILLNRKRKTINKIECITSDEEQIVEINTKNTKEIKDISKINFKSIDSKQLENISYLEENYPLLFKTNTIISFKVFEFSNGFPQISQRLFGKVEYFNKESKSFLIRLIKNNDDISQNSLFNHFIDYYSDVTIDKEDLLINLSLKDLIELQFESADMNDDKIIIEKNNKVDNQIKTFQRQIEFYFTDPYYSNNSYLQSKLDENGFISISIIFHFNKIRALNIPYNEMIESLRNNDIIDISDDLKKIRKKP